MSLDRSDFTEFFETLHRESLAGTAQAERSVVAPFPWQERLLDSVLATGQWAEQVVAPTGAGKTSVIDVHVFAQALCPAADADRPPRRLAMVVDRRVLVDDQYEYARRLERRLLEAQDGSILAAVRRALQSLRDVAEPYGALLDDQAPESPLLVGRLRGGAPPSRHWRDFPTAAAVVCGTPDMWGSRLLFRGYGSSPRAWPREAGLLAVDSVVVVDEAHLARQLLVTARRVAELVTVTAEPVPWRALQVVEATATPPRSSSDQRVPASVAGVDDSDLEALGLRDRLTSPKPVTLVSVTDWDSPKQTAKVIAPLADEVLELISNVPDAPGATRTVGCFVNTVGRAVAVADELRRRSIDDRALRVVMVCGQVRPYDLARLRDEHPGLLSVAGSPDVDVIVSTQSLEVGVDLDLAGVVTELASGSAIAQRAGRVNRRGLRPEGRVVVTVPAGSVAGGPDGPGITANTRSGPYGDIELRAALEWLMERSTDPDGLAPWQLRIHRPPEQAPHRDHYQEPQLAEAWHWARTSERLAADPELDLWLAEDFDQDTSAGLVVRDGMPTDSADAVKLITALPPQEHEAFSVPYRTLRKVLVAHFQPLQSAGTAKSGQTEEPAPEVVVVRGDQIGVLEWRQGEGRSPSPLIRPGDTVVIDSTSPIFSVTKAGVAFSPPVVVAPDDDRADLETATTSDVLDGSGMYGRAALVGNVVLRIEPDRTAPITAGWSSAPFARLAAGLSDETLTLGQQHDVVSAWLEHDGKHFRTSPMVRAAAELLARGAGRREEQLRRAQLIVHRDADRGLERVVVVDRRRAGRDEDVRQVWAPTDESVLLTDHQSHVGERASAIARSLQLPEGFVEAMQLAGEHHDAGKADPRFQRRLGATDNRLLAKSDHRLSFAEVRALEDRSGLPARWRHEQRSVAESWVSIEGSGVQDPQLVARLVGTTHGHGRSGFPHNARGLLTSDDDSAVVAAAITLFDDGMWDELIEHTQIRYGPWGCAYLEALLRAADGQVSMEGS